VILSIITSLFIAIQDPIIQKFAVRVAGGYLSEKTGAEIKVGRLAIMPDFSVMLDDVLVKDLRDNNLANIGRLRTKIHLGDLLDGVLHLSKVELDDTEANLIQYQGEDHYNYQFLADFFSSDKEKDPDKKPMKIIVDDINIKGLDFVFWDQNSSDMEKSMNNLMDYAHIDVDDITLKAKDFYMYGDSIHAVIEGLSATELSGLDLKHLQADATVSSKGILLDGLKMETNNSKFDLDLHMLYNDYSAFKHFVDSVTFDATIYPSDIMLSDIGVFTPVMYEMPDRVKLECRFSGPIEHFEVGDISAELGQSTHFQGYLSMHPLDFNHGEHVMNIKNMQFNYDDIVNFKVPGAGNIPLPESLRALDGGNVKVNFKGSYLDFMSDIAFVSDVGNVDASINRGKDVYGNNEFSGYVNAQQVAMGEIAKASKVLGDIDLDAEFSARFPQKGSPELSVNGNAYHANVFGNTIDKIKLDGDLKENRFNGKLNVKDPLLDLDFNGLVDFQNAKYPKSDFEAVIHKADLKALNLVKSDSVSVISTRIYANMTGFDIDNLEGTLRIDSTVYHNGSGALYMDSFDANIVNDNLMQRRINLNCDFFNFDMGGQFSFADIVPVFKEYVNSFVTIPKWEGDMAKLEKKRQKHNMEQDFYLNLNLKDTKPLSRLFMPSLTIADNTTLNGTFTSRSNALNITLRSKYVKYGDIVVDNIELKNYNFNKSSIAHLSVDDVSWSKVSETDTLEFGFDNLSFLTRIANDTVYGHLGWDDDELEDHNKASIDMTFHPDEGGGVFNLTKMGLVVNDSLWAVSPSNYIGFDKGRIEVSDLEFSHNRQKIRIDGYVPLGVTDTIALDLNQFDLSNLDLLFQKWGFDIDGFVTGSLQAGSLKENPMLLADAMIEDVVVNNVTIGDAKLLSQWDNAKESVGIDASIFHKKKQALSVVGTYYPRREKDNVDLAVRMDSLNMSVINPFVGNAVSRVKGYGKGEVAVTGSINAPDLNGKIDIVDGGCKVGYLNTYYSFSPTILLTPEYIGLKNLVLVDTLGNSAPAEGRVYHKAFKDLRLDLKMHPRDFLAMATTIKENDTFYGTVFADGVVSATGPINDINLSIKAKTERGTSLVLPLNRTTSIKENDFIVFVNNALDEEESEEIVDEVKAKSNLAVNLDVDVTDAASVKLFLPGNVGVIDATGNGNLRLGTSSSDALSLIGRYVIKGGRFQLNLKNVITRNFNLKSGGTISWSGSPTDGRIDATGAYHVKADLSSLGVQIDSTMNMNNKVSVECLIHLKGALLNPTITFGMKLPNASEDTQQTVYSIIDTTDQSVMGGQVLSLLLLGSFNNTGGGTSDYFNAFANNMLGGISFEITPHLGMSLSHDMGSANTYEEWMMSLRSDVFDNRLLMDFNLGVIMNNSDSTEFNAISNMVAECDINYRLMKDGRLMAHFYNHSNYNTNYSSFSFDKLSPYTQGLGLTYSKSFNTFGELFRRKNADPQRPFINRRNNPNN